MLTTREHNPSSRQPLRVLCQRHRLAMCAPATCSRTSKVSSISDSMRVPLGFGWTPEHSALWPMSKNARTGKLRLTNVHPTSAPRTTNLASSLASEFWVSSLLPCVALLRASPPTVAPRNGPVCAECQSGVHCQLGPVEEFQTVHHHFQTPSVEAVLVWVEVEFPHKHVRPHSSPCFSANPRLPNTPIVAHAAR